MTAHRPVEIVGGGLAGLSLGRALARAGVAVTVFEAGDYPRHRVCGEFLAGLDGATVERLDLKPALAGALRHRSVGWFKDGSLACAQRLPAPAFGLSRRALDGRLAEAFVADGGALATRTRLTASGDPPPGRVFATGRRPGRPAWIGLKMHVLGLRTAHDLEVHLGRGAYVGLSAVEGGRINVCGLFRRKRVPMPGGPAAGGRPFGLEALLASLDDAGLGPLAGRLAASEIDLSSFSSVTVASFDRGVGGGPRLCIGDACASIAPFTGNGMAMAFQSAESALGPLVDYARGAAGWAATRRRIQAASRRRFRVRLAAAAALHGSLLRPPRQRWILALHRARLLPLRPLYALLH